MNMFGGESGGVRESDLKLGHKKKGGVVNGSREVGSASSTP